MIFVFAGEASADLLGAELLKALLQLRPELTIFGVLGPRMRQTPAKTLLNMEEFQVMGFTDILFALPRLLKNFFFLRKEILKRNPDCVLCIDAPDITLRLEKSLRKKGYKGKLIHYVCPSIWAWKRGRRKQMVETLDLLLTLLPFEPTLFKGTSLDVRYVGHPLAESATPAANPDPQLIALFPGSRKKEILRNFPYQLQAAACLPKQRFIVSVSHPTFRPLLEKMVQESGLAISLGTTQEILQQCSFAIAKCGTIALELALHHIPTVVIYALSPLDYFLGRYVFRILLPYYSLPNILLGKEVFPELIGPFLTAEALADKVKNFFSSKTAQEECKKNCIAIQSAFGHKRSSFEAASAILEKL